LANTDIHLPPVPPGRAETIFERLPCFTAKCAIEKRNFVARGVSTGSRAAKSPPYGLQLREKQKVKRTSGTGTANAQLL